MAFFVKTNSQKPGPKKRTSIGNGLRKLGSYKKKNQKPSKGQGSK